MDIVQNRTVRNAIPEFESRRTVYRSEEKDGTDVDSDHLRHEDLLDVSFLSRLMLRSLSHTGDFLTKCYWWGTVQKGNIFGIKVLREGQRKKFKICMRIGTKNGQTRQSTKFHVHPPYRYSF